MLARFPGGKMFQSCRQDRIDIDARNIILAVGSIDAVDSNKNFRSCIQGIGCCLNKTARAIGAVNGYKPTAATPEKPDLETVVVGSDPIITGYIVDVDDARSRSSYIKLVERCILQCESA